MSVKKKGNGLLCVQNEVKIQPDILSNSHLCNCSLYFCYVDYKMSRVMRKLVFCIYVKTKMQSASR